MNPELQQSQSQRNIENELQLQLQDRIDVLDEKIETLVEDKGSLELHIAKQELEFTVRTDEFNRERRLLQSQIDDILGKYREKEAEIKYLQGELESSINEKITLKNQISQLEHRKQHEHCEHGNEQQQISHEECENKDENELFNRINKLKIYLKTALKTEDPSTTSQV